MRGLYVFAAMISTERNLNGTSFSDAHFVRNNPATLASALLANQKIDS